MAFIEFNEHGGGGGYYPRTEISLSHYGALDLTALAEYQMAGHTFNWFDVHPLHNQEYADSFLPLENDVHPKISDTLAFISEGRRIVRNIGGVIFGAKVGVDFAHAVLEASVPELTQAEREKVLPPDRDYYFTRTNGLSLRMDFTIAVIDKMNSAEPIVYQHPDFVNGLTL